MSNEATRTLWLTAMFLTLFPFAIDAWAQARLPAQMYYPELSTRATRPVDAGRLSVIPASTVLQDQELTQLAIWIGGDSRAIARAAALTGELRRRGVLHSDEQIVGLSGGQALKVRSGEVASLRPVTGAEIVAAE